MEKPESIEIKCDYCGMSFQQRVDDIDQYVTVHKGIETPQTVDRYVTCTICERKQIISLPQTWFDTNE